MITREKIESLIAEKLESDGAFLVDLTVSAGNRISVTIDSEVGVPISYCIAISRQIEHNLDRETEDFALDVSSSGVNQPLKLPRQYKKNMGRQIEVLTNDDKKLHGKLIAASEDSFTIETQEKVKVEGKKKKELVISSQTFKFEDVNYVKVVVSFK